MEQTEYTLTDWIALGKRKGYIREKGPKYEYVPAGFADKSTDPEEQVRAAFYVELIEHYGYPPERIDFEIETPRREPHDYADIVIYEDDAKTKRYCVVECKPDGISQAEIEQAAKQAGGNASNLGARYGMVVAGNVRLVFEAKSWDPKRPLDSGVIADLPLCYGKAQVPLLEAAGGLARSGRGQRIAVAGRVPTVPRHSLGRRAAQSGRGL